MSILNNIRSTSSDLLAKCGQSSTSAYRKFRDEISDHNIPQLKDLRSMSSVDLQNKCKNSLITKSSPKSIIELLSGDTTDILQTQLPYSTLSSPS